MKVTQMPPVHAANLVAKSGNQAYGVHLIISRGFMWPHHGLLISEFRVGLTKACKEKRHVVMATPGAPFTNMEQL